MAQMVQSPQQNPEEFLNPEDTRNAGTLYGDFNSLSVVEKRDDARGNGLKETMRNAG